MNVRTPYTYKPRVLGSCFDRVVVDVVDTSVDNVKNSVSLGASSSGKPFYTNSDVPVKVFDNGILATRYNPLLNRSQATAEVRNVAAASEQVANAANIASSSAAETSQNTVQ